MGIYRFEYDPEIPGEAVVKVTFDDARHPMLEYIVNAFHQFLLGVTYQPGSISKVLNTAEIDRQLARDAEIEALLHAPKP